jgi:hypothetical protein
MSSPASILRKLLIDASLAPDSTTQTWSPFVSQLPDDPDTSMALYDTAGVLQGRIMRTGEQIEKYGVQIRMRSSNYAGVFSKAVSIRDYLDFLMPGAIVAVPGESWRIQNISRSSGILTTGIEVDGDRKRHNLIINVLVTAQKVT